MPSRRYDEHGYLLVDEKPFYAIRKSKYPAKKSPHGDVDHFLEQLDALDFQHIESDDLIALTKKIVKNGLVIPLGSLGLIDYFIECAQLRPGSLNNDGKQTREERAHVPELLQKLAFTNVNGVEGAKSARLALPLGRLYANHHHENRFTQSRWIIMIDQTRLIWALYADGIDKDDADKKSNGNLYPYNGAWDTAFGANRAGGERVVLLGSISDIPFQEGQRLDHIRVQGGVGWSTTPSEVDLRKPLIDPSVVHRLLEIDTRLFDIPDSTIFKCKNIFELEHDYGYWSFCWSVQNYNEVNGFVIGRTLVEGAWCKIVTWFFKNSADGRKDVGLRKCVNSFNDCIAQSQGKDGQKFWDKLEKKYPGLDVAVGLSFSNNDSTVQLTPHRLPLSICPPTTTQASSNTYSPDRRISSALLRSVLRSRRNQSPRIRWTLLKRKSSQLSKESLR